MRPLHIAFAIPGIPFDGNTLETKSLGGSETAALCLARELAALGHKVYVFNSCENAGEYDGVQYLPLEDFQKFAPFTPHDVCVIQRMPEIFGTRNLSKMNIIWCHDLPMFRFMPNFKSVLWNVDQVALLSDYMIDEYKKTYDLNDDLIFKTRNGIDKNLFISDKVIARDPNKLLYTARPERGLDNLLLKIFPALLERHPDLKLYLCKYDNPAPQLNEFYARCEAAAASFGDRVIDLGNLTKRELYEQMLSARALLYPTPSPYAPRFNEVSCITAMECMQAGLPMITSNRGALPETLHGGAGALIGGTPSEYLYDDHFIQAADSVISDDALFRQMSEFGQDASANNDWSAVAKEWEENIYKFLESKNEPAKLVHHLTKTGDAIAAQVIDPEFKINNQLVDQSPDQSCGQILEQWAKGIDAKNILIIGTNYPEIKQLFPDAYIDTKPKSEDTEYDLIIAASDLEYKTKPWDRLNELKSWLAPDGFIICLSAFGPWRQGSRQWNFEAADWEEMCGHLKSFNLYSIISGINENTGEIIGWTACRFQNSDDDFKVKQFNIKRKIELTRPDPMLSVNIIAGKGSESTIRWTLESVVDIADEIVVGNTGMSQDALIICSDFGCKIIDAPDPLEYGFDSARNAVLDASKGDWIFWIDTDERLVDPCNLKKYLRTSYWHGYGIKQHHFCVDTYFKPDMPVRLFRNNLPGDQKLKFIGMVHEHPELGINKGPGAIIILADLSIAHVGYLTESVRKKRFMRNNPLLEKDLKKYPDRIFNKHLKMRDNMLMASYEMGMSQGQITPHIQSLCDETIQLFKDHFLGQQLYSGLDSIQYYSDACKLLEIGAEIHFQVFASTDQDIPQPSFRFATQEDAEKHIQWNTSETIKNFFRFDY